MSLTFLYSNELLKQCTFHTSNHIVKHFGGSLSDSNKKIPSAKESYHNQGKSSEKALMQKFIQEVTHSTHNQ